MIPLILFKLPLLSQWTQTSSSLLPSTLPAVRGENVDPWYCCIMKSFQHGARPPSELNLQFCFFPYSAHSVGLNLSFPLCFLLWPSPFVYVILFFLLHLFHFTLAVYYSFPSIHQHKPLLLKHGGKQGVNNTQNSCNIKQYVCTLMEYSVWTAVPWKLILIIDGWKVLISWC